MSDEPVSPERLISGYLSTIERLERSLKRARDDLRWAEEHMGKFEVERDDTRADLATARQDAERARAHVRRLVNVATNWCHHSAHCECNACETVWQGRTFLSGALATPTPGPVPGRGLDPLTVEACVREVEAVFREAGEDTERRPAVKVFVTAWGIGRRLRSLTSPTDTTGKVYTSCRSGEHNHCAIEECGCTCHASPADTKERP